MIIRTEIKDFYPMDEKSVKTNDSEEQMNRYALPGHLVVLKDSVKKANPAYLLNTDSVYQVSRAYESEWVRTLLVEIVGEGTFHQREFLDYEPQSAEDDQKHPEWAENHKLELTARKFERLSDFFLQSGFKSPSTFIVAHPSSVDRIDLNELVGLTVYFNESAVGPMPYVENGQPYIIDGWHSYRNMVGIKLRRNGKRIPDINYTLDAFDCFGVGSGCDAYNTLAEYCKAVRLESQKKPMGDLSLYVPMDAEEDVAGPVAVIPSSDVVFLPVYGKVIDLADFVGQTVVYNGLIGNDNHTMHYGDTLSHGSEYEIKKCEIMKGNIWKGEVRIWISSRDKQYPGWGGWRDIRAFELTKDALFSLDYEFKLLQQYNSGMAQGFLGKTEAESIADHLFPTGEELAETRKQLSDLHNGASGTKTLHNTDFSGAEQNVPDIVKWGDADSFQLICKASSNKEGWMKSTKAMEIYGVGCVVQVTTQNGDNVAEAVCFVPGVKIRTEYKDNKVCGRRLVEITPSIIA